MLLEEHNAGLQLRRAISIQAEGKKLLKKHAVAPSTARLCYTAPHCSGFSIAHAGTRKRGALQIIQEQKYQAGSAPRAHPKHSSLALLYWFSNSGTRDNAGLQLRRAISTQPEGTKLLEKHAIAPSAARLCYAAR